MSVRDIYYSLRAGGLSPAGACAIMGNMHAESVMMSNNVQDNCPLGDADYTFNVEHGITSANQFIHDKYGYGLCQWTFYSRKEKLLNFAARMEKPISDEAMQVAFCLEELKSDYASLYAYLCTVENLKEATDKVCKVYEQPAVNNYDDRRGFAQYYYAMFVDSAPASEPQAEPDPPEQRCSVSVRILRIGSMGRDVYALQCAMDDMGYKCGKPDGDFGPKTENAVNFLKLSYGLEQDGIADADVWQILLQKV